MNELAKNAWRAHFRACSDGPEFGADFGAVLGAPSMTELQDLIAAKDADIANVKNTGASATWSDPIAQEDWNRDFSALESRYDTARTEAALGISAATASLNTSPLTFIPATLAPATTLSMVPAGALYDNVVRALQQTAGVTSTGDLVDLATRVPGGVAGIAIPQPGSGTDFDLNVMQAADSTIKNVIQPVGAALKTGAEIGLGTITVAAGIALGVFVAFELSRR